MQAKAEYGRLDGCGGLSNSTLQALLIILKSSLEYAARERYMPQVEFVLKCPEVKQEPANDAQYAGLSAEIQALQARLAEIDSTRQKNENAVEHINEIISMAADMKHLVMGFDDKIVRQMIACIKVISSEKLLVIFKTGLEREVLLM